MNIFSKPTIAKLEADELYQARRLLLDYEAKRDHARAVLMHHEANVTVMQDRVDRLGRLHQITGPGPAGFNLSQRWEGGLAAQQAANPYGANQSNDLRVPARDPSLADRGDQP